MSARPDHLTPVPQDGGWPAYDFGPNDRLPAHYFTMFHHHRWLNSALHLSASMDVQGAALNLFFIAQSQTPIGTLPRDHALLARLLRIDAHVWEGLHKREMGALHNWVPCQCGDEVRLMHPVVLEGLRDAFAKREARDLANTEKAVSARLDRLRTALVNLGCDKAVVADGILIERMDAWLVQNCPGQRRASVYEQALAHAGRAGWLNMKGRGG